MEIGNEIYLEPKSNAARYSKEIKTVTIKKIGRKYFEVNEMNGRFFIDTLEIDGGQYTPEWQGYLSLKHIEDKIESEKICNELRQFFNGRVGLPIEKMREIRNMIN